ncbi:MAG: hypothetical protein IKJ25_02960, partial [Clostridia bacterium]|nr:hypothetical protein [Clostridia bacterium]
FLWYNNAIVFDLLSKIQGENSTQRTIFMVVDQLLKYGEFGIVLFDNFQVTERTRNQLYLAVPWVRIPPLPPSKSPYPQGKGFYFFVFLNYSTILEAAFTSKT